MFRKVRKMALKFGGVVVFFDEADTLGSRSLNVGGQGDGGGFRNEMHPFGSTHACNGVSYFGPSTSQTLFQQANREHAASVPQDQAIGRNRFMMMGGMGGGGGTLQQLLTEMSGLRKPRGFFNTKGRRFFGLKPRPAPQYRILWILATNLPSALDKALLRPGRIDRQYRVGYPAKPGRIRTYEGYFKKVKHELTADHLDRLATMTPYATGASMHMGPL